MAMPNSLIHCFNCDEQDDIYQCKGCSKSFCYSHLSNHRQELQQNVNELQDNLNLFKQNLQDFQNHFPLFEQINQWEIDSINKIKQTANQCRENILTYTTKFNIQLKNNLNDLSEKSKLISKETKLNEILLNEINEKLDKLKQEFYKPLNISIQKYSTSFIDRVYIKTPLLKEKWKQNGIIVAGGNDQGNNLDQLSGPRGISIDSHQTIYISDTGNERIVEWKLNAQKGRIVAGGNGRGKQINQLNYPTDVLFDKETNSLIIADHENRRVMKWSLENNTINGQIVIQYIDCHGLAMDKDGSLYVSDSKKNEVRRWKKGETDGRLIAGGNGEGKQLNQLKYPTYIFVDGNYSLYVTDTGNHRVIKWTKDAKEGMIVAGGNGQGNSLKQLSHPQGVIVDDLGRIYVADCGNHRVMCWSEQDVEGRVIVGGNDAGNQSNQLSRPIGLSFDIDGNLYTVDNGNNRISKFETESNQ